MTGYDNVERTVKLLRGIHSLLISAQFHLRKYQSRLGQMEAVIQMEHKEKSDSAKIGALLTCLSKKYLDVYNNFS